MIRRAVFWTFSTQIANFVIQFGSSVIVARLLSPQELGVFAVAVAIMGIVQLVAAFGVSNYVIREETLSPTTLDTAFTINAVLSCGLGLAIFVSSYATTYFLRDGSVASVLRVVALTPVLGIVSFRPSVMLQRAMQLRGVSLIGTAGAIVMAAVTIAAALAGASSMSFAYGSVAGAAFSSVGTLAIGREHLSMRMSMREWRPILAFGLRIMSIGGISGAATRVSDLILGHFLGLAALGLYSRANNLTNLLFYNVYGSATRVVFAKLCEARREGDRVTEVYLHGYRVIVAVMGPLLLGLAVLSRPAIHVLYGDRWLGAAIPLSLLLLGQLVSLTFAMNWELFVLRDELATQTRLELARSVIGVTTQAIGSMFSLVVVSATSIFDNLVSYIMYQRHMPRLAGTTPGTFYRAYGEAALLSVAAALPAFLLMLWYGWAPTPPLPLVFASVGVGVLLWLMLIVATRHPMLREINIALAKLTRDRLVLGRSARA